MKKLIIYRVYNINDTPNTNADATFFDFKKEREAIKTVHLLNLCENTHGWVYADVIFNN